MIEKQLEAIKTHDAVLCAAVMNSGAIKRHNKSRVTLDDLRKGNCFDPSSFMAKTSVLKEVPFDEQLREGEDWDIFIRIAEKYSIGYVNEPLLLYHDGGHERITNEAKNLSPGDLERRMSIFSKHRGFFGQFWSDYHRASVLLSYLVYRNGKLSRIAYAIQQCGLVPVAAVFVNKIRNSAKRHSTMN